jgi:Lrp/AsnC family transcriptional regulator, leucine-responsive regulatory protein
MDAIDRQLLTLLQANGRLSYNALGHQVGLSVSAVHERLRKLQVAGVLRGNVALVDPHAVGLDVCAFMQVLTDRPENEAVFRKQVGILPEVQECHHITGEFSYLLKIRTRSTLHFESLLQQIKSLPGVMRTYTHVVLSTQKETTSLPLYADEASVGA